ncbi:serine/threonine protein kinase, partial [Planctomycetota bacterium]|nr:serine/threonine protein kinase [Planctomycetota bacterium]
PEESPRAGEVLGERYRLIREIGRGGMGVIYEAFDERPTDPKSTRRAAIKLLHAVAATHAHVRNRFEREGLLAGRLKEYPGIVSVFDTGSIPETGELYLVMEFVDGNSLDKLVIRGLDRVHGAHLVACTARAVHYAHQNEVVHRDLKPANVMVTKAGAVRLTDFGVAKALDDAGGMTATGTKLGTPHYMAPEQVEDSKRANVVTDVYSLGGILYTVITRKLPFTGRNLAQVLRQVTSGKIVPPIEVDPKVPAGLNAIVMRAMSKTPGERPQTAEALAEELEAWVKQNLPKPPNLRRNG